MRRIVAAAALVVTASASGACAQASQAARGQPSVDVSVAPIADIVRHVVGDRARVVELVPEGVDSHSFEPSPRTAKELARADVVFLNGLHLEDPTLKLARAD